jgi:hypothetical protein
MRGGTNPQQVLLPAEVTFESHALDNLSGLDPASLDLASHLFRLVGNERYLCASDRDELRICRVRFATVQPAAVRRSAARCSVFATKVSRELSRNITMPRHCRVTLSRRASPLGLTGQPQS